MHDITLIKEELARRAGDLCYHLFPEGHVRYGKFYVGDLEGNPGRSLVINIDGSRAGLWKDFATDQGGSNLLELLLQKSGNQSFSTVCDEAEKWLNLPKDYIKKTQRSSPAINHGSQLQLVDMYGLEKGSAADLRLLSHLLKIGVDGIQLAQQEGFLRFCHHPTNGRCWSVIDGSHFVRQDRRLDGKPFLLKDNDGVKARTLGCPKIPLGLPTKKPLILLCEGSSDFLAAFHLACVEYLEYEVAPVAILGASNAIHESYLPHFLGKHVIAFPDYDSAGIWGMKRWEKQLTTVAKSFEIYDYQQLKRDDGAFIKDLRDFIGVNGSDWEDNYEVRSPLGAFLEDTLTGRE